MKVWLVSDTHFGIKNNDETWLNIFNEYFQKELIPFFKDNVSKDDILIHCGDVFDNRKTIGLNTINVVLDIFSQLNNIFSSIKIITGNHDMYNKNIRDIVSIDILQYFSNVTIYKNESYEIIDGKKCLFVPFCNDSEEEKSILNKYRKSGIDYVFCHSDIANTMLGIGNYSRSSLQLSNYNGIEVYSGHIHYRSTTKNIHYIGTPYSMTRNDYNNPKGVYSLDLKTGKSEFIENTVSPRFIKVNYKDIDYSTIDDIIRNNYVDLFVVENEASVKNISDFIDNYKHIAKSIYVQIIDSKKSDINIDIDKKLGIKDYIKQYIDNLEIEDDIKTKVSKYIENIEGYNDL